MVLFQRFVGLWKNLRMTCGEFSSHAYRFASGIRFLLYCYKSFVWLLVGLQFRLGLIGILVKSLCSRWAGPKAVKVWIYSFLFRILREFLSFRLSNTSFTSSQDIDQLS